MNLTLSSVLLSISLGDNYLIALFIFASPQEIEFSTESITNVMVESRCFLDLVLKIIYNILVFSSTYYFQIAL